MIHSGQVVNKLRSSLNSHCEIGINMYIYILVYTYYIRSQCSTVFTILCVCEYHRRAANLNGLLLNDPLQFVCRVGREIRVKLEMKTKHASRSYVKSRSQCSTVFTILCVCEYHRRAANLNGLLLNDPLQFVCRVGREIRVKLEMKTKHASRSYVKSRSQCSTVFTILCVCEYHRRAANLNGLLLNDPFSPEICSPTHASKAHHKLQNILYHKNGGTRAA